MKTEIPNAKYIQAILDGKEVECEIRNYVASPDHWRVVDIATIVKCPTLTYRIKPELAPKREPLTVHVYSDAGNFLWLSRSDGQEGGTYLGAFVLQPKEQT